MDRGHIDGVGIYDRDYYRQGRSGFRLRAPRSAVGAIILINVAVFALEIGEWVVRAEPGEPPKVFSYRSEVIRLLSAHVNVGNRHDDTLRQPWMWWQLLTCGFVHDTALMAHILFNMLILFFLGRDVEDYYGTREFIRLYLVTLVFSSLVWAVTNRLFDPHQASTLLGASGAISGVVVLYALNFPRRTLLLMFVIPVPAWLLGALAIAYDIIGAMGRGDDNVAYTAHLGGAALALAYFNLRWNFGQLYHSAATWLKGRSRPALKVFKPENDPDAPVSDEEVDRILAKINREGKNSLTRKERRILDNASLEYRRRRRPE
jgi:membrane associated rhomboid family serine protease